MLRFWLDRGVDGFRIDAIPHLYEVANLSMDILPGDVSYINSKIEKIDNFSIYSQTMDLYIHRTHNQLFYYYHYYHYYYLNSLSEYI